ncbi:MAG: hypothetical protein ACI4O9_07700 [Akkermansia sp.]
MIALFLAWGMAVVPLLPPTAQAEVAEAAAVVSPRVAGVSALERIPSGADAFVAFGHGDTLTRLWPAARGEEQGVLESVALAFSSGSVEVFKRLLPLQGLPSDDLVMNGGELWAESAGDKARAVIEQQMVQPRNELRERLLSTLMELRVPPIYLVCRVKEEHRERLPQLQEELLQGLTEELQDVADVEAYAEGEWRGQRLRLRLPEMEGLSPLQQMQLRAALRDLPLYALSSICGRDVVIVICSDPAQVHPAERVEESLACAPETAFAEGVPRPLMLAACRAELMELLTDHRMTPLCRLGGFVSAVFKTLAQGDVPEAAVYAEAARSVELLQGMLGRGSEQPVQRDTRVWAWADEALHVGAECDACGLSFEGRPQVQIPEGTGLFVSCDRPVGAELPDLAAMVGACDALAEGVALTLRPEERAQSMQGLTMLRCAAEGVLDELRAALQQAQAASDGSFTLLVRREPSELEDAVALCCGVEQRAALEACWVHTETALRRAAQNLGAELPAVSAWPIVCMTAGDATLYAAPIAPGFSPGVAVSDRRFVLSSSSKLCSSVAQLPEQPASERPGIRFCLLPAELGPLESPCCGNEDSEKACAELLLRSVHSLSGEVTAGEGGTLQLRVEVTPAR